tara:strand:- start:379 stop:501 length:123 start_codon:yes stop_codon:yes gene_type:complete
MEEVIIPISDELKLEKDARELAEMVEEGMIRRLKQSIPNL